MSLNNSILKVLACFDLFDYPISAEEIGFFLDRRTDPVSLSIALESLLATRRIFKLNSFYSLHDDFKLALRRLKGNDRAATLLAIAAKNSAFLFQFPFVRGISISGSLSKNFASEKADIDYFIITAPDRLWIARTFMHFYKKLTFLTGRQHRYCMNYYIDERALEIEEKNVFTAIELITLKPFCGNGAVDSFFHKNDWTGDFYPNYKPGSGNKRLSVKDSRFKKFIESLFNNAFGDWLDNYFMRLTTRRWNKKEEQKKLNMKGGRMGLRTDKHFSKPNPVFFQHKLLSRYSTKLQELGISGTTEPGLLTVVK